MFAMQRYRGLPVHLFFEDYIERFQEIYNDLARAIDGLPQAALDWVPGPDMNSLCVLVVHVVGATRYWVGDVPLGDDSKRDRDAEFQASGLSAATLKALLAESELYIRQAMERIDFESLGKSMPAPGHAGREFTVGWSLLHALEHASLHLGHAQITRQLWDQQTA